MAEVNEILTEREKTHGIYKNHADIAQRLKFTMRKTPGWQVLTDSQAEALEMIAHKIARILNGNPNINDHWDDIAGYATLASKTVTEAQICNNT